MTDGENTVFTAVHGTGNNAGRGGIQITANNLTMQTSAINIDNFTSFQTGDLTLNLTGRLSMSSMVSTPPALLSTTTRGAAQAAPLNITAHDVALRGNVQVASKTVVTANPGSGTGDSGPINITTQTLELVNGAQITSSTVSGRQGIPSGHGGTVTIHGLSGPADSVLIDSAGSGFFTPFQSPGVGSGIFTDTQGTGAGGNINILSNNVTLQNGGTLSAATSSTAPGAGHGGTILVQANTVNMTTGGHMTASSTGTGAAGQITVQGLASPAQSVLIDGAGSGISSEAKNTGAGGNIVVDANSVTLHNGGHISSSSTGTGPAGDITINAGNQLVMTNSSVTTEAVHSSGGAIKITTNPNGMVELTDSKISASVLDGAGGGGSVNIDPQFVILDNSQIIANSVFGPGGNINITANLLLPDSTSVISASSQFGQQGNIVIQSPISPASGKIVPLSQKPLIATTLLGQRCAALAGGNISSFTVAGRDALPAEPGSWMSSPLAFSIVEAAATASESEETLPLVSLRKIAPSGFLTQNFAVSTDCTS
jgi:hypothetical protein